MLLKASFFAVLPYPIWVEVWGGWVAGNIEAGICFKGLVPSTAITLGGVRGKEELRAPEVYIPSV